MDMDMELGVDRLFIAEEYAGWGSDPGPGQQTLFS